MRGTIFVISVLFLAVTLQSYPDCGSATSSIPHLTIAEIKARLIAAPWPGSPPGARIEGYAVFQVKVSSVGKVDCVASVGGHPLLLSLLTPALRTWKFRQGTPFIGVVAVRYSSEGFQLL